MPKYEVQDLNNMFCWTKFNDGSYIVDVRHEQEFIEQYNREVATNA